MGVLPCHVGDALDFLLVPEMPFVDQLRHGARLSDGVDDHTSAFVQDGQGLSNGLADRGKINGSIQSDRWLIRRRAGPGGAE